MLLSFDVGIINLAYCILEKKENNIEIKDWKLIDICNNNLCLKCSKKALYGNKNNEFYCKSHIEQKDIKFDEIFEECNNNICNHKNCKKKSYYNLKTGNTFFCKVHSNLYYKNLIKDNEVKKVKNEINYNELLKNIIIQLDKEKILLHCEKVIIENQPSMKNPKMKSIAITLYNYFLIRGIIDGNIKEVLFVSPTNKLKNIKGTTKKLTYKETKKLSIDYCYKFLEENNNTWKNFYENNKKKDDLADSFLQGLYFLTK